MDEGDLGPTHTVQYTHTKRQKENVRDWKSLGEKGNA